MTVKKNGREPVNEVNDTWDSTVPGGVNPKTGETNQPKKGKTYGTRNRPY